MQDKSFIVYIHTCPNMKRYVGITCKRPALRWGNEGVRYKQNRHFWNAICKYGWENIKHDIIADTLTETEAKQVEQELIRAFNAQNPKYGYNHTAGGDGTTGFIPSDATRKKISEANKGRHPTDATRKKLSEAATGRHHTDVAREKIGAAQRGKRESKTRTNVERDKMRIVAKCKQVIQYFGGLEIARFVSIAEAGRKTGICGGDICRCCSGKSKHAGGFSWRYVDGATTI